MLKPVRMQDTLKFTLSLAERKIKTFYRSLLRPSANQVIAVEDTYSSAQVFFSLKGLDDAAMPMSRGSLRLCS